MSLTAQLRSIVIGGVVASSVLVPIMWSRAESADREIGLGRDKIEALADTTRLLRIGSKFLADGAVAYQRRAVQEAQRADDLDRALKLERKAKLELTVTVASRDTTVAGANTLDSGDVRVGRWYSLRATPFTFDSIRVESPLPPLLAKLTIAVRLDPMPLDLRLGCGAPNRENNGIRPAALTVTAPKWAHVQIGDVTQDDAVCNAKKQSWLGNWRTWALASVGFLAAVLH